MLVSVKIGFASTMTVCVCVQVFFCERSDYFKALVEDHFGEASSSSSSVPVITLRDISAPVFYRILTYVYQDTCEVSQPLLSTGTC